MGPVLVKGKDQNDATVSLRVGNDGYLGPNDGEYATTGTLSGDYGMIFAHSAAVLNLTSSTITGTLTSVEIPAGAYYRGRFSSITITSGKITAYNASSIN